MSASLSVFLLHAIAAGETGQGSAAVVKAHIDDAEAMIADAMAEYQAILDSI